MVEPPKAGIVVAFAVTLVIATVLMAGLVWALERFAGLSVGSGGAGIVPPLIAAIVAGQRHVMAVRAAPRGGYAWTVAAWFVVVTFALSAAGVALAWALDRSGTAAVLGSFRALLTGVEIAAILGGLALVLWGILRWAYSFGARTQLKAQARAKT